MNMLNTTDILALSPLIIICLGALLLLLMATFTSKKTDDLAAVVAAFIIFLAIVAALYSPTSNSPLLIPWIQFDGLTRYFTLFFLSIGFAVTLLSRTFFARFQVQQGEYYFLLLSSLFGLILIGAAADFLTLFIGLETLSLALYILCGYTKKWKISHESAVKYVLIGSIAAAILLYGIALIYGAVGSTQLGGLLSAYQTIDGSQRFLFLVGTSLVTIGLAFKAALVPFHNWAPDVYEGAPTPVTAFMAVGTKVGAFAAFVRIFLEALPQFDPLWSKMMTLVACITLVYANIVAIKQSHLKRFFAYSGISHAGFLLIPLLVGTQEALSALLTYLVVYAIATIGAFAVLVLLDTRSEGLNFKDLPGLMRRKPFYASLFALCLLTLAGIPPTVGFFAKFYLFQLAFQEGHYSIIIVALLTTILAAYYYLRILSIMLAEGDDVVSTPHKASRAVKGVALAVFVGIIFLSLVPGFVVL